MVNKEFWTVRIYLPGNTNPVDFARVFTPQAAAEVVKTLCNYQKDRTIVCDVTYSPPYEAG